MALGGAPQPRPRSQVGRPSRLVLDDHESFQGAQVGVRRVIVQVGIHGRRGRVGRHVASKGVQEAPNLDRVAADPIDSCDVYPTNLVEIVPIGLQRLVHGTLEMSGPSAHGDVLGKLAEG